MPERIQLRRAKGWRLPPGAVSVARPSRFANPYKIAPHGPYTRAEALAMYERDLRAGKLASQPGRAPVTVAEVRRELAGRDLACYCPPGLPCHAGILLAIANTPGTAEAEER